MRTKVYILHSSGATENIGDSDEDPVDAMKDAMAWLDFEIKSIEHSRQAEAEEALSQAEAEAQAQEVAK